MVTKHPFLGRHPVRHLPQALVLGLTLMPSVADLYISQCTTRPTRSMDGIPCLP